MRIDGNNISPTNPYHIARAYGLNALSQSRSQSPGAASVAETKANARPAHVEPSAAQRLVAAVVPGRVDFSGSAPQPGGAPLAFYRHPADRNAAAVNVQIGRSLDVSG